MSPCTGKILWKKNQLKLCINTLICWNKNQTWMIVGVCYDFNCAIVPLVPWFDDLPNIWVLPNSWCNNSWTCYQHTHTQLFNGPLSGTTLVSQYLKKHSPTHTHEEEEASSALSLRGLLQRWLKFVFNCSLIFYLFIFIYFAHQIQFTVDLIHEDMMNELKQQGWT